MIRIHIDYKFTDGPYGGANQFLKTLKEFLVNIKTYEEDPQNADVILINHISISDEVLQAKRKLPHIVLVHRLDGPVSKHRKNGLLIDKQAYLLNRLVCDGTIFQSNWTRNNCYNLGYTPNKKEVVIYNAPNPKLYYIKENNMSAIDSGKIKLITTSWSANWNKGFDIMTFLDNNLDFSKYEYTFVGRTPVAFKNIQIKLPMTGDQLSKELREHNIYVALSKNESCSNSVIEAINSGLPVLARNSGSYPELIKEGGIVFDTKNDCISKLNLLVENIEQYQRNICYYDIQDIGMQYYNFMLDVTTINKNKRLSNFKLMIWKISLFMLNFYIRVTNKLHIEGKNEKN